MSAADTVKIAAMSSSEAVSQRLYFIERSARTSRWCVRVLSELEAGFRHASVSECVDVLYLKSVDALKI